ncbi:hypothetical protein [Gemmatimonas sp.]|uniref:hypothetical protein n=1 Tax=Gemmatimonas sp. TaxID=1962908 RepID=UPI003983CC2E
MSSPLSAGPDEGPPHWVVRTASKALRLFVCSILTFGTNGCSQENGATVDEYRLQSIRTLTVPDSIAGGELIDADLLGATGIVFASGTGRGLSLLRWDGTFAELARYGQGPCELALASGLAVDADGTILVSDSRNRRVQRYGKKGCISEISLPSLFISRMWSTTSGIRVHAQRTSRSSVMLLRGDFPVADPMVELKFSSDPERSLCTYCWMAVAPNGAIYSRVQADTVYRIARYSAGGRPAGYIEREGVPIVRMSDADTDSVEMFRRGLAAKAPNEAARRSIEMALKSYPITPYKFLFAGMPIVDVQNHLFIARSSNMGEPVPVDVFDAPSGKFLGEVRLPAGSKLVRSTEQGILVFRDEDEAGPSFSVYRLERASLASDSSALPPSAKEQR